MNPFIIYYFISLQVERAVDTEARTFFVLDATLISSRPLHLSSPQACRLSASVGYAECVGCAGAQGPEGGTVGQHRDARGTPEITVVGIEPKPASSYLTHMVQLTVV